MGYSRVRRIGAVASLGVVGVLALLLALPGAEAAGRKCFGKTPTIKSNATVIRATNGNDAILAGRGDNQIYGRKVFDLICSGGGPGVIYGGPGNDGSNNDLGGDEGNDRVYGQDGNDNIDGGDGDDFCDGGPGHPLRNRGMSRSLRRSWSPRAYGAGSHPSSARCSSPSWSPRSRPAPRPPPSW